MTKFNAKASFMKNNHELKFPRRQISIWYKHGPTCLVLPTDLTVHMDVELNPGDRNCRDCVTKECYI